MGARTFFGRPGRFIETVTMQQLHDYRLLKRLGAGAFGEVWATACPRTGTPFAIKILRASIDAEARVFGPSAADRFRTEAELLLGLSHPSLVRVYKVLTDAPPLAYVMEYLEGTPLSAVDDVPAEWLCHILEQIASALGYLHRNGIVHRDVKADNVFVSSPKAPFPRAKLLDLGVAKSVELSASQTLLGTLVGTAQSMSPECFYRLADDQIPITGHVDQWAFGIMMYKLLTGRRPFTATGLCDLIAQIQDEPLPPIVLRRSLTHSPIARALIPIVERCLEKRPEHRYPDMETVQARLSAARQSAGNWAMDTQPNFVIPTQARASTPADTLDHRPPPPSGFQDSIDILVDDLEAPTAIRAAPGSHWMSSVFESLADLPTIYEACPVAP